VQGECKQPPIVALSAERYPGFDHKLLPKSNHTFDSQLLAITTDTTLTTRGLLRSILCLGCLDVLSSVGPRWGCAMAENGGLDHVPVPMYTRCRWLIVASLLSQSIG
jgi:hypothetical protein